MKIEERLSDSGKNSSNSSLLWAQWCFDKQLITRSLNVISTLFPHYSLHESSHSNTIILEIEKILGSNVNQLSFIDSWLLLEAAYWHDVGMIVTDEEKRAIIETQEFNDYIRQLSLSTSELSQYAKNYIQFQSGEISQTIIEYEKSFTFLFAEYIRKSHSERSKLALKNPDLLGIKSPQTGLINSRFNNILGDIVEAHGKSFESILSLPFENDGLEVGDVAHPRFVACMLRLGDLLDLEDGRHCPTQLKTVGKIPAVSFAHLEKHRSIISKTITEYSIDIKAKCEKYESFELQNDWFALIEKEIENQDKFWVDISPNYYSRKLPSIKSLICDLEGSISLENRASRFTIDINRIYDFLNGKYIYENSLSCMHELLQNAVDATIDRLWLEKKDSITTINDFREIASNYSITVQVIPKQLSKEKVEYKVVISDKGKGMTIEDIKSILTIASEKNQQQKELNRLGMPEWMKPSGFFGIGLQSVFSLTDELFITTRSASDNQYDITIKTSIGKMPSFVVKKKDTNVWNFGTTITFSILDDAIPVRVSGHNAVFNSLAQFDPLEDLILNTKEAQIEEEVSKFAQFCVFPVHFNNIEMGNYREEFQITDINNGIEYAIEFMLQSHSYEWSYRGRPFKPDQRFKYLNIKGNIISERADSFLPLNREIIHQSGRALLEEKVKSSLLEKQKEILHIVKNKDIASLYYFLMGKEFDQTWRTIELSKHKISSLIEVGKKMDISFDLRETDNIEHDESKILITNGNDHADVLVDILLKLNYGLIISNIYEAESNDRYINSKRMVEIYSVEIVADKSFSKMEDNAISYLSSKKLSKYRNRYWLPCGEMQMEDISIELNDKYLWLRYLTPFCNFFKFGIILRSTSKTLEHDISTLVDSVKKYKPTLTKSQIEKSLRKFYEQYPFDSIDFKRDHFI